MPPFNGPDHGNPERTERLQELGQVTGELLHDLGGLLSVLVNRVALAAEEASLGRVSSEELRQIQEDSEELRNMVLEILDELRGGARSPEMTFLVTPTVEQVVNRWLVGAPATTTTLHSTLPADARVEGPRSFFVRTVANLLRNASRHARSRIRLTLRLAKQAAWLEMLVEDDGDGIPDELMEEIFEPFVSTGSGAGAGMGLGLSFARWGVQKLGGQLRLRGESKDLGGACFQILLPLGGGGRRPEGAEAAPSIRTLRGSDAPLTGLSVAVVDDDEPVRHVFGRLLRRAGATVVEVDPAGWMTAAVGVGALEEEFPDVILLDLNLGRISGVEFYDALVDAGSELARRILFLTGGDIPDPEPDRPVVSKLVTWTELCARIRVVAEDRAPPAGGRTT